MTIDRHDVVQTGDQSLTKGEPDNEIFDVARGRHHYRIAKPVELDRDWALDRDGALDRQASPVRQYPFEGLCGRPAHLTSTTKSVSWSSAAIRTGIDLDAGVFDNVS